MKSSFTILPPRPAAPIDYNSFINPFNNKLLLNYYFSVRNFHGAIKFLGMGSVREKVTRDIHMDALFVMPRLHERHITAPEAVAEPNLLNEALPLLDALQKHPRLVVLGDPGSGKSTLVQYIADGLCRTIDNSVRNALGSLVPLPIILRELNLSKLNESPTFDTLLQAWLDSPLRPVPAVFRQQAARELLVRLLKSGQALILIDGLDEVGDITLRQHLRCALWNGMDLFPAARWVITSRIIGYSAVEVHHQLVDVDKERLENWQARALAQGYSKEDIESMPQPRDQTIVAELAYTAPFAQGQIAQFAHNWMQAMGDTEHEAQRNTNAFLQGINDRPSTKQLAPTPIFLTFMGLVFRSSRDFPNGRAELFRLIVRAYVESIEKDKFGHSALPEGLSVQIIDHLLNRIGWESQLLRSQPQQDRNTNQNKEHRDVLIPESILSNWLRNELENILPAQEINLAIDKLLRYLGERTGLIIPRGRLNSYNGQSSEEHYAFLHLSIQEFLSARWLYERMTDDAWMENERHSYHSKNNIFANSIPDVQADLRLLPSDSLPVLRKRTFDPLWHEVFFLLHEIWQKPTPLFRLFGTDPWQYIGHEKSFESIKNSILLNENFTQKINQQQLLTAIALDESNGLSLHLHLRRQLLRALNGWCCNHWGSSADTISRLLHRRGSMAEESWAALCNEVHETFPPYITLPDCHWLTHRHLLEVIGDHTYLHGLNLTNCNNLKDIRPISRLINLDKLSLSGCKELVDLNPICNLIDIKELNIGSCINIHDLSPLQSLKKLEKLDIGGCTNLTSLKPLESLSNLIKLFAIGCENLHNFYPIQHLSNLKELIISDSKGTLDTSSFKHLSNLDNLLMINFVRMKDIFWIKHLTKLTRLFLINFSKLEDISPVRFLYNLKALNLTGCDNLIDISSISSLTNLSILKLGGCSKIADFSPIENLKCITNLDISGCTEISQRQLSKLRKIFPKALIII